MTGRSYGLSFWPLCGLSDGLSRRRRKVSPILSPLLEEAGNIFSIIAARLFKVSHYLELLEEEESAREILEAIDNDAIDKIVNEFYCFTAELKEGGVPLISRAVQFAGTIDRVFAPERIGHLFDRCLLNRLNSLLSDFTNAAYGIRFRNQETVFDMNISVRDLLEKLKTNPHENESILESRRRRGCGVQDYSGP